MSATCAYRGIEAAVGPHRELAPGSAVAHPPHRFTQEVGSTAGGVGPVGVGPRRSGQLRPNRGQRGPWKHPEPAAQGPRGPKQGGSMVCGGIHVGVRAGRASMGLSRRGARPAPGPAVDRKRRSGRRPLRRSAIEACLGPLAHRPLDLSRPPRWPLPGPLPLIPPPRLVRRRPAYPLGQAHMVISEALYIYY